MKFINASSAPQTGDAYSQAIELDGASSLLFVSGQIPVCDEGIVPSSFGDQARLVWRNIEAQLGAAGMGLADIVKVTTFLSDRRHREENSHIRRQILGKHAPALTVIICDIYDESWLLEIEVVAAR
ncbi:MAG TPA: RidA family protein [Sphingopyxis sp.]|mgnify:CR=1 FL=1|nr:RidA family protein [Sphingopyxis sp.]HMP45397.1 RidA family protein [Sphingopyxis sp.]HMQ20667.1 RidA family protein [Sphingopyxis sp.]